MTAGLSADRPAWRSRPSWFVYGDDDRIVPPAGHRRMAQRAEPHLHRVLRDGSHAVCVSQPDAVADVILHAVAAVR
ncbi:alpha/beta hydrolase [Nakamurella silvestris]|nr:alpha/beta hydrolase [Nakamurella silvestris]